MKLADFKPGQTVYLQIVENSNAVRRIRNVNDLEEWVIETKVFKVGRKYIIVDRDPAWTIKFNAENDFREESEYAEEYILHLTKEDAMKAVRSLKKYRAMRSKISDLGYRKEAPMSEEDIDAINEILKKY